MWAWAINAARLAVGLIKSTEPIETATIDGLVDVASSSWAGKTKSHQLDRHADRLRRKSETFFTRATENELAWISQSAGLIEGLMRFLAAGNDLGVSTTIDLLRRCGWGETIEQIALQLAAVPKTDPVEFRGRLRKATRDLFERERAKSKENTGG